MFKLFKHKRKINRNRSLAGSGHFELKPETKRGIGVIILFTVALFSLLSFFEATGSLGTSIASVLGNLFGWADWLLPVLLLFLSYYLLRPGTYTVRLVNYIGFFLILASVTGLLDLTVREHELKQILDTGAGGGLLGYVVGHAVYRYTALPGSFILLLAILCIGSFIFFNTSFATVSQLWNALRERLRSLFTKKERGDSQNEPDYTINFHTNEMAETEGENEGPPEKGSDEEEAEEESDDSSQEEHHAPPRRRRVLPKIELPLDLLTSSDAVPASGDIKANMRKIETTLKSFSIDVTMGDVNVGPTVTQYTLKPLEGVKLNQITALNSDLALALAAHPIRIEAPIPGKSLVGIEVPNQTVSVVKLKELLQSGVYSNRKSDLMVALGKDVMGKVMMADLGKMPHLLIAGATGSGKSVCINSIIVSLLYQNSPDILKLILVDPKRVELSSYDGIPHLVAPVIIDIEKTINALRWAVGQMDGRYKLLAAAGKKNIEAYNSARLVDKMPYIVIIIDELADLMMVAAKEVESAIIRLAQMARAVGIHLVLATQRPSVNVITGLIKANITTRIAFAVASATDSRTIIDSSGAEKLLGNGDMLYISAELSKPKRIQGALIMDEEITAVTDYLKAHGEPDYEPNVTERKSGSSIAGNSFEFGGEESDIRAATQVVVRARRASATLLQSRMRIGFAKASRLLDLLEDRGIIGPQNSSKPRDVLITEEEFKRTMGTAEYESASEYASDAPLEEYSPDDEKTEEDIEEDH